MSKGLVLVTGGAGFIGSHLVDALLAEGYRVRALDNLLEQAHPTGAARFLSKEAELLRGDLRDREVVDRALDGVELVFHTGGIVGNGQSMHDARRYLDINAVGTATLMEALIARRGQVRRLVHSSSMVVYGDGTYRCPRHGIGAAAVRPLERLRRQQWEPVCDRCGEELSPEPTAEEHALRPTSPYGISKRDQEELVTVLGRAHGVPALSLRYLNVYGSRQAMSNPYTGVAALLINQLLNGRRPLIFEDALQRRDFVHVSDVVRANLAAAEAPEAALYGTYNVGTGRSVTLLELGRQIAAGLGASPELIAPSGAYRAGDIRHCFADVSAARDRLGWTARLTLADGLGELLTWAASERPADVVPAATEELSRRNLIIWPEQERRP